MGKHKYIETPEKMWELFEAYRKKVKQSPFEIKDWVGKDAEQVTREKEKPLTIEGFECYCSDEGIIDELGHYFSNLNDSYTDYLPICSRIRRHVRRDQIEGGMAGMYNPSITQRLNGLVDKTENDNKTKLEGDINITFDIT